MIIGICGGSGSGKTTLLKRLCEELKQHQPSVFSMDNYYLPIEQQQRDVKGEVNFDLPTALDRQKLFNDLKQLVEGQPIEVREYHFNAPPDRITLLTIEPSAIIIVEGLFLFHYSEIRELIDFSIFMEVDPEIQLDRRLYRDQDTRGYSREAILYQWNEHVLPCYKKYLQPYESLADFRFHNDSRADQEFERLLYEIHMRIAQKTH
jgi:uridine kinase